MGDVALYVEVYASLGSRAKAKAEEKYPDHIATKAWIQYNYYGLAIKQGSLVKYKVRMRKKKRSET